MAGFLRSTLIFDGAMGTLLQEKGLKPGACPEFMNISEPEKVREVHEAYLQAGADVIGTNTFGGNRIKLAEYGLADRVYEINRRAVELAKIEASKKQNSFVAASVGPTGQFVEPLGKMTFPEAYEVFKEQIEALADKEPDIILFETFSDLGEMRAALLASKDVCRIPAICCLTYSGGRTLTGVSPHSAAVILESLGASGIGANCSGGPQELFPVIKELQDNTGLPILVQPNAGLPVFKDGQVIYPLDPQKFITAMEPYFNLGIPFIGSCCGSTPRHTAQLKERFTTYRPLETKRKLVSTLASREQVVEIGTGLLPKIIGERINPTARKKLAEALRQGNLGLIQKEAETQTEKGAHLLDVNVGTHGIDEPCVMRKVVNLLQQSITAPLVIDSTNPAVIQGALETYHGKALVNSVNGEDAVLNGILPVIKRYGAGVIGLTLDERGIPSTAEGRLKIAEKIIKKCQEQGIRREDVYIDSLVMTVGTDDRAPGETLKAIRLVKEKLGVNTILGVSNVSHGLPNRGKINGAFLAMAIANGLDLAIINPLDELMLDTWQSASLLAGRDKRAANYLYLNSAEAKTLEPETTEEKPSLEMVAKMVLRGSQSISEIICELLAQGLEPLQIINQGLIPGLNIVGEKFEKGEYFLPQLMLSAETAQKAFDILEARLKGQSKIAKKATIIVGTVKGDVHDIGKNMVAVMLKNHGYEVIDLGKNVSQEEFLRAVQEKDAQFLALSALMTTTMQEIPQIITFIKKRLPQVKIIIGGAVVTEDFAQEAGADGYGKDAVSAVKLVERLRGE